MFTIDFSKDEPQVCVNKLFNNIQSIRTDATIMRGKKEKFKIDNGIIAAAEALVRELKQTKEINNKA